MNRSIAPSYSQAEDLKLVMPVKVELANGAVLYWMKDVKDDSVKLDIEWEAGTKYQDKKLVAGFTNKMLLSGTAVKNSKEIAEAVDFYGGYSQLEVDKDHAGVVLYGLSENIGNIFNVFSQAFDGASFPEDEFMKERDISLNNFRVESQKVKVLCRRAFGINLYGESTPYGHVAVEEDFNQLEAKDLRVYYEQKYRVAPVMFLTGNVSEDFINQLKSWTESLNPASADKPNQEFIQTKGRIDVEKKDAVQSAIRIGRLMFDKNHPDYFNFQLMNTILGGYFGSRLMANIREDKGYTYGIGSGMAVLEDAGYFFIATEVGSDVKEAAIEEIYKEIDRLKTELVSDDELTKVKNYMLGEFLRQADGPIAMMEVHKNIYFNRLKNTYYSDFIAAIHATTAEDLQRLVMKYLVRDEMLEVVAG